MADPDLDHGAVRDVLREKGVSHLHHANSVRTACTFLSQAGLLSRGAASDLGLEQTPQESDKTDQLVGVWYDIFFDGVDIHHRARRRNDYGPVLFCFDVDLLRSPGLPPLRITRNNPWYWKPESLMEARYYMNVDEFAAEYEFGDFFRMLTLREAREPLPCFPYLRRIVLDDPTRELDGREAFDLAAASLSHAALAGSVAGREGLLVERRRCRFGCKCSNAYRAMTESELRFWFS